MINSLITKKINNIKANKINYYGLFLNEIILN